MRILLVAALLVTSACTRTLVDYQSPYYTVRSGDTLYSIAWRHGVSPGDLAAWNGLTNPDMIREGQRLAVRRGATAPPSRPQASGSPASRPPAVRAAAAVPVEPAPEWQWPTAGTVASEFGGNGSLASGIGIAGRAGQPVVAAADGRVVYTGSGLIGYGQLIIVKHNETYLSAYGHNRRLLVVQGQQVARGQAIAEMGTGPGQAPMLHFEIRRNGDPVNPLGFLGARR